MRINPLIVCGLMLVIVLLQAQIGCAATQDAYCVVPPYITQNVKPNINLVLDFTGSMQGPAYLPDCTWAQDSGNTSKCTNYDTSGDPDMPVAYRYKVAKDYWGMFKMDSYYKYDTTNAYWVENTNAACSYATSNAKFRKGSFADGSGGCISGNLLNWGIMTRTDVLRKVLTGGRIKGLSASSTTTTTPDVFESEGSRYYIKDPDLGCDIAITYATAGDPRSRRVAFSNRGGVANACYVGTLAASNIDVKTTTPTDDKKGIIDSFFPGQADMEVTVFTTGLTPGVIYRVGKNNETNNNTVALETAALDAMKNAVNNEQPWGGTNTGPAIRESQNFFQQGTAQYATNQSRIDKGNYLKDPFYEYGALPATCKKVFTIVISDGDYNSGEDPVIPAYDMRHNDLRSEAAMPGTQRGTTYAIYAFGNSVSGRQSMITTALFGGFDDLDNNNWPYPFTALPGNSLTTSYPLAQCNIITSDSTSSVVVSTGSKSLTVGTGLSITVGKAINIAFYDPDTVGIDYNTSMVGTVSSYNSTTGALVVNISAVSGSGTYALWRTFTTVSWNTACGEWDKNKTGLPYNYFEATDGSILQRELAKAITDILGRVSSGTAASILGNNDNNGATLLQALFFPEKQFESTTKAKWLGEVQAFWYYLDPRLANITIRSDSVQDNKLKLSEDLISEFVFDGSNVNVNLYADANGDGVKDNPTTPTAVTSVDDVQALWRAGLSLFKRDASSRIIYTNDPAVTTTVGSLIDFSTSTRETMKSYFDLGTTGTTLNTDADNLINFTRGVHVAGLRDRRVTITDTTVSPAVLYTNTVWKLGDIINSTPKMLSSGRINSYDLEYGDRTYADFLNSNYFNTNNGSSAATFEGYKKRGVAFVGANDGMLHAIKLGVNSSGTTGYVAELKNADGTAASDLGKELWGFIPKNTLPYLKHMTNTAYKHLYYVDSTPLLVDASIGVTKYNSGGTVLTCNSGLSGTAYFDCPRVTTKATVSGIPTVSYDISSDPVSGLSKGTSWRTVLIGSMGQGGASRDSTATCTDCVKAPIADLGYSSYFALDVTKQDAPQLLWEFATPLLGYSTVGAAVARVKASTDTAAIPRNGRWFAVLASGFSGPVIPASLQMKAITDQPLRIFVLDLKTGDVLRTFSREAGTALAGMPAGTHTQVASMPDLAFGGSLSFATLDTDRKTPASSGYYSDDAIYLGYVRKDTTSADAAHGLNKFTKGGVLRILTGDNPDPATWKVSTVIDGTGPVTSAVTKIQKKENVPADSALWLYFGTGRYFYKDGATVDEDYGDSTSKQQLEAMYGIKEPCYNTATNDLNLSPDATTGVSTCTSSVTLSTLTDQTTTISAATLITSGWKVLLSGASPADNTATPPVPAYSAKRIITDPVSSSTGTLFFTAFKPTSAVCGYGGESSFWALKYDNGGAPPPKLKGQALIQLSTGSFQQIDLPTAFTQSLGRETTSFTGVPPKAPPAITSNADHYPSKRVLHIMER